MSSLFDFGIFCSIITFSHFHILLVNGQGDHQNQPSDQDNIQNLQNLEKLAELENLAFQTEHMQGLPYEHVAQHQESAKIIEDHLYQLHQQQQAYEQANKQNFENNQNQIKNPSQIQIPNQSHYQDKKPIVVKEEKGPIVLSSEKKESPPPAPIIISHGKMLKHFSDIIIHDQRCGTPTRIKETKHGLMGLFHKSHIIIIGKDCAHHKMVPVFAPKLTTPIHLHQGQTQSLANHHYGHSSHWALPEEHVDSEDWHQESDMWPEAEEGRTSTIKVPSPHSSLRHNQTPTTHQQQPSHLHSAPVPEYSEKDHRQSAPQIIEPQTPKPTHHQPTRSSRNPITNFINRNLFL